MPYILNLCGRRFGRLVAVSLLRRPTRWVCQCDCGEESVVSTKNLTNGSTNSCGCLLRIGIPRSHGMRHTKVYEVWKAMLQRCGNPKNKAYPRYGGRGITVCERWKSFENFHSDMGQRPVGASLERVNNDLGYCPENCIWGDDKAQARNKSDSRFVEWNGERLTIGEWAERAVVSQQLVCSRLNRGWTMEKALFTPPLLKFKKNPGRRKASQGELEIQKST